MLNKIEQFKKDAQLAQRDPNSIDEFKLWLNAGKKADTIPTAVKEVDREYIKLKDVKNCMTKLYHELSGEDATDCSEVLGQLDKALENMEVLLERYAS